MGWGGCHRVTEEEKRGKGIVPGGGFMDILVVWIPCLLGCLGRLAWDDYLGLLPGIDTWD